jgi:general secretion pathway protein D
MTVVTKAKFRSLIILLGVAGGLGGLAEERAIAQDTPPDAATKKPRRIRAPKAPTVPTPTPEPPQPQVQQPGAPGTAEQGPPPIKPFETGIDYQPTSPSTRVTFNLEDADLPELVRMMSQITGRSFILPSKSRSIKATVYAPTKVTAAEAYQAFLSILELNGMAVVPSGRYLKIVESGRVEGRAVPMFSGADDVPIGDRYVTRIQSVRNISAEDASKLLERFKSGDGGLVAYAPTNTLIMTDTGTNLRRMLRILDVVDIARTGEQIWVEPVHHANASDLEKRLSDIFDVSKDKDPKKAPPAPSGGSTTIGGGESRLTKVIADERTNSLVIVATEPAYLRVLEMLKYLDISMEGEGRMHVHHLQHSDAEEVASTLSNLIGKGGQGGKGGGQQGGGGNDPNSNVFEGKVAVTAHKASNALVITSSTHDYAALKSVINLLDSQRKQVFIEAVIMELSVNRTSKLGLGYHGGLQNTPADNAISVLGFNATKTVTGLIGGAASGDFLTGLAVGVQGPKIVDSQIGFSIPAFGVAIQALASAGDTNVLSTPHLIASDNVEAEISIGENVPLQTSTSGGLGGLPAGLLGGAAGQANPLGALGGLGGLGGLGFGGAVPRQDVGTTVTITPHLNDASEIRLTIAEEISEAGEPSQSGNLGVRSIRRTKAKTEVVVRDQQTVVIGGLMRDQVVTSSSRVPILGDIPLLGMLFRTNDKIKSKRNLLLFLTPYIIRSPADLRAIYERKMRERQEFVDRYFVFTDSNYEAPVDYSRTRGLFGEMLKELIAQDHERLLLAEAAKKPELGHSPRTAVGAGMGNRQQQQEDNSSSPNAPGPGQPAPLPGATPPPAQGAPGSPEAGGAVQAPPPAAEGAPPAPPPD